MEMDSLRLYGVRKGMYEKKDTRSYKILYTEVRAHLTLEIRRTKREGYLYLCVKEKNRIKARFTVIERISQILSSIYNDKVILTPNIQHIVPYILCDVPEFEKSYGKYIEYSDLYDIKDLIYTHPVSWEKDWERTCSALSDLLEGDNARLLSLSELPDCDVPRL